MRSLLTWSCKAAGGEQRGMGTLLHRLKLYGNRPPQRVRFLHEQFWSDNGHSSFWNSENGPARSETGWGYSEPSNAPLLIKNSEEYYSNHLSGRLHETMFWIQSVSVTTFRHSILAQQFLEPFWWHPCSTCHQSSEDPNVSFQWNTCACSDGVRLAPHKQIFQSSFSLIESRMKVNSCN